MRYSIPLVVLLLPLAAACGGGGGGSPAPGTFTVLATVPADGSADLDPAATLSATFSRAADPATLTIDTVVLRREDGSAVPASILTTPLNPSLVRLQPVFDLEPDAPYRFVVTSGVRAADGEPLGADEEVCFFTKGPVPAVRPDQVVDLGDRLHVARYLAQVVRSGARTVVLGGFRDATSATDSVEEWDPATRGFRLLPVRLLAPRAEFTATVLGDGRVLVAGGVSSPGGPPLATTEILDLSSGSAPGPSLVTARRWHAASRFRGGGVLVSGGFGASGAALDSIELLENGAWKEHADRLGVPTAQHLQFLHGFDDVYATVGNLLATAARIDTLSVTPLTEGDARFRPSGAVTGDGRALVVAGDTRSVVIHDFDSRLSWLGRELLLERRGAFSLTTWGSTGRLYLAAGGFQVTAGDRTLRSLEIIEYLADAGGRPDAVTHAVTAAELPVAFAGHVGFNDPGGATVLAGGIGDGAGDHSRRAVMILDDRTTPPPSCR